MNAPALSLVFPAWNEAANLPDLLASALAIGEQLGVPFEIVIVDDGSQDASRALLDGWCRADARIRAVHHATNQGYGAALRAGLLTARGEFVFFSDADLQFELAEIRRLLDHAADFEIVAGYRAPRRDPWARRVIAAVWGTLVRSLFDLPVRDIDCAFKIFDRRVLDAIPIRSVGAFVNTEILVRARAAGFRIKQVPVTHRRRRSGRQSGAHPRVILHALVELAQLYSSLHHAAASAARSAPVRSGPLHGSVGGPLSSPLSGPLSGHASGHASSPASPWPRTFRAPSPVAGVRPELGAGHESTGRCACC